MDIWFASNENFEHIASKNKDPNLEIEITSKIS